MVFAILHWYEHCNIKTLNIYTTDLELTLDGPQTFLGLSSLAVGVAQLNLHLISPS